MGKFAKHRHAIVTASQRSPVKFVAIISAFLVAGLSVNAVFRWGWRRRVKTVPHDGKHSPMGNYEQVASAWSVGSDDALLPEIQTAASREELLLVTDDWRQQSFV